jgi:hypothetical protein
MADSDTRANASQPHMSTPAIIRKVTSWSTSTTHDSKSDSAVIPPPSQHSTQDQLKKLMREDLKGAKWRLEPEDLAKALSRKTLKSTSQPLQPDEIDDISRYDLDIDLISDDELTEAAHALEDFTPSKSKQEREHYEALSGYMNECLAQCRLSFPQVADRYHSNLRFEAYDRETKDGITGAHPLKPDLVGVHAPLFDKARVSWAPKDPERDPTLFIPVEVKDDFDGLLAQASTYARGLFSVSPLRQFALVLGYNQHTFELRFLVYHCGGVSMNEPLSLKDPAHKKEILRLFLSILTWETDGDAGLPEWFKGTMMRLPGHAKDEKGLLVELTKILSNNFCIRGRSQKVYRCSIVSGRRRRRTFRSLAPVTSRYPSGLRRSERIAEKAAALPPSSK